MPPKQKTPAPIDRPLSRAYLREFTGWSTAYPPGISDPTSLRLMENVMINRDGSARIRPGLRHLSYEDDLATLGVEQRMVGTYEPFFLNNGTKAYLYAVREDDGTVGFRVLQQTSLGLIVRGLTEAGIDFSVPQTEAVLAFSEDTTYVKYLQIDNKIFALSNAGEAMRYFTVGVTKSAKKLSSVTRPDWSVPDKIAVVHPDASWVNTGIPNSTRLNRILSPSMEGISEWVDTVDTLIERSPTVAQAGTYSGRVTSIPERTNLMKNPLNDPGTTGPGSWFAGSNVDSLDTFSGEIRANIGAGPTINRQARVGSPKSDVVEGEAYRFSFQLESISGGISDMFVRFVWFGASGAEVGSHTDIDLNIGTIPDRKNPAAVVAPNGAEQLRVYIYAEMSSTSAQNFRFKEVLVCLEDEDQTFFSGDSGANYFWSGTPDDSASLYHPPADVEVYTTVTDIEAGEDYYVAGYYRAGSTVRTVTQAIQWRKADNSTISSDNGTPTADASGSWTRMTTADAAPSLATQARIRVMIPTVARGEYHYIDSFIFEEGTVADTYFDGDSADTSTVQYLWTGDPYASTSIEAEYTTPVSIPSAETPTVDTLISSASADNTFNFGFFYTFGTEIGESAASMATMIRTQRAWAAWRWETPDASGEPSGTATTDPSAVADQLVAFVPQPVFEAAIDQGATHWSLYMFTWSDQDPVPVTAVLVDTRQLVPGALHASLGWIRVTPQTSSSVNDIALLPSLSNRYNSTEPSGGAQGLVAADRMVIVNDPGAAAVIRWTSNQQGHYSNFSAAKGGGYKTLTSGNLFVPAAVKLWQNPQSADTLTILCLGVDGYSTGYYMAPAQVASQSEATNIMGFEETTATPGTTSPFGCEVVNNALYHPLDEQLMKSTATNYNINHKSMTDQITDQWQALVNKHLIVSSHLDNRLYFLVDNNGGEELEVDCRGNEVWVLDTASKTPHWSRWLTQGHSLRRIEQAGRVMMSLVRPDGLFVFDESYDRDDVVDPTTRLLSTEFIPWFLETNIQGANRAHDAWAHLQQANIVVGNFQGEMSYGVRGLDLNGMRIDISKVVRDTDAPGEEAWDLEDNLLIRRDLKEWFFYAGCTRDDEGVVQLSSGQLNLVQYRYTPSTVNSGYEFGSIETFEYQRAGQSSDSRTTDNGVPMPYVDTGRP